MAAAVSQYESDAYRCTTTSLARLHDLKPSHQRPFRGAEQIHRWPNKIHKVASITGPFFLSNSPSTTNMLIKYTITRVVYHTIAYERKRPTQKKRKDYAAVAVNR
jgi:hypothetical protein